MPSNDISPRIDTSPRYIWAIAAATALVHLLFAGRYDLMRNELYFLVCGWHPDFGYVDHPPLVPLLSAATQLFGHSILLLRLPAVAAAAALVPLTANIARLLGATPRAIIFAAIAAAISPALIGTTALLTTQTFEPLMWTACSYFVTRALIRNDPRSLLWAGVVVGVSMEAKYGIMMWAIPLAIGLLATSERRVFASRHLWIGAALAIVIGAPSVLWQWVHGWPFVIAIMHHSSQNLPGPAWRFELTQALSINIVLVPLCIASVITPFTMQQLRPARFLAIAFVAATALDILAVGKDYYLFPVYPTTFAVGAVAISNFKPWLTRMWLVTALAVSVVMAPLALPILPPAVLQTYMARTHLRPPPDETAGIGAPLTQIFSDEFGWEALEKQVAAIYNSLPPEERQHAAIFGASYGEAAAVDVYGKADGLPPAISPEDQYFLWGTHDYDGSVIIHINGDPARWRRLCSSVTVAGTFGVEYAMPYERDRPIFICRGLRVPFASLWPRLQRYL